MVVANIIEILVFLRYITKASKRKLCLCHVLATEGMIPWSFYRSIDRTWIMIVLKGIGTIYINTHNKILNCGLPLSSRVVFIFDYTLRWLQDETDYRQGSNIQCPKSQPKSSCNCLDCLTLILIDIRESGVKRAGWYCSFIYRDYNRKGWRTREYWLNIYHQLSSKNRAGACNSQTTIPRIQINV